jgi:hypothetical protein
LLEVRPNTTRSVSADAQTWDSADGPMPFRKSVIGLEIRGEFKNLTPGCLGDVGMEGAISCALNRSRMVP